MQVAAGVHRFTFGVSNWYAFEGSGKLTLVDAGTPADWRHLLELVREQGGTLDNVDSVLLTHAHSDHTGFAERARREAGATVRVHAEDREAALTGKPAKSQGGFARHLLRIESYRTLFGLLFRGATRIVPIKEVSTFSEGELLDVPGRPRVVHVPGHTQGSAAIWFEGHSTLCTGDALVTRNPLTGRIGPQIMPDALNGDSEEGLRSLDHLTSLGAALLLPGHGEPWTGGLEDALRRARTAGRS